MTIAAIKMTVVLQFKPKLITAGNMLIITRGKLRPSGYNATYPVDSQMIILYKLLLFISMFAILIKLQFYNL